LNCFDQLLTVRGIKSHRFLDEEMFPRPGHIHATRLELVMGGSYNYRVNIGFRQHLTFVRVGFLVTTLLHRLLSSFGLEVGTCN
jgi:hypothetical protein